jgi:hypothetical protein
MLCGVVFVSACSAGPPPREAASASTRHEPAPSAEPTEADAVNEASPHDNARSSELATPDAQRGAVTPDALPAACEKRDDVCIPPRDFVERLCQGSFPSVALAMFEKESPWTRGYLNVKEVAAVNTIGGPAGSTKLVFGEELIVLGKRGGGGGGGFQVSGMGGFDVLRWDGTCATLAEHELVTYVPGVPRTAPIVWKYLDDNVQQALLENAGIRDARDKHRKQCQGASLGTPSSACQRATQLLNDKIAVAVRTGLKVPTPTRLP